MTAALAPPVGPSLRSRWLAPAAIAAVAGAAAVAASVRDPFRPGAWPVCPFHALTGWYCPLCGSTRAFYALAHGQIGLMVDSNLMLPLWLALAVWGWLRWLSKLQLLPARMAVPAAGAGVWCTALAAGAVFWVARNLPALAVLAPHGHP